MRNMFWYLKKENEVNGDVEVKDYCCLLILWVLDWSVKKYEFGLKFLVFDLKDEYCVILVKGRGKIMIDLSYISLFLFLFVV